MIKITISAEDAGKLESSLFDFQVCDPAGRVLATVKRDLTPEFVAELKRRAALPGPRYSGEQMREMLATLQSVWDRDGPFESDRLQGIMEELHQKWSQ